MSAIAPEKTSQTLPIPKTAAEVPGPVSGNTMTKEYVQMVGQMAYFWGWPLAVNANRSVAFFKAPEPGLVGGEIPIAYGGIAMLTDYVTSKQRVIACSNQDVVYGPGGHFDESEAARLQRRYGSVTPAQWRHV